MRPPKQLRSTSYVISPLNYKMASTKRKNHKPSRSKHTRRMVNISLQTNTRRALIPDYLTKTRIDVASVEILLILKGFSAQPRNTSAKHATSLATTHAFASKKHNKTIQLQAQETHCASIESWYHTCA